LKKYRDPKKTDWKDKNLCMHKGLQFEKYIDENFKQYNNEERKYFK
jgi:hypothetical protein